MMMRQLLKTTITSRRGDWIITWSKEGKKISARSAN